MSEAKTTQPLKADDAEESPEATSNFKEPQRNLAERIWFNVKDCFTRCTNGCRDSLRRCCDRRQNCNQLSRRASQGEDIDSDENNMWVDNDNTLAVMNEENSEIIIDQDSGQQTEDQQDLYKRNSSHRNSKQDKKDVENELPIKRDVELEPETTSRDLLRASIHQDSASSAQHSSGHRETYAPKLGHQSLGHENKSHHDHSTGLQETMQQDSSQHDAGHHRTSHHDATHHTSSHHDATHHTSSHYDDTHHTSSHHDTGHHTSSHHDTHHTSSHQDSEPYTSSYDSGGGGYDGGDTGGND